MFHVGEHLRACSGAGEARAEPVCEARACTVSGGVGKPLLPSLLSFHNFFVKTIIRKIVKHFHTFASLSVSHYAQAHVFVPEVPAVFKRKRIVICKRQRLLGSSLRAAGHSGGSVAEQGERRGYLWFLHAALTLCHSRQRLTESQNSRGWKGPLWVV